MARRLKPGEGRLTEEQRDLVAANLGLVGMFAERYAHGDRHLKDLYFQAGAIGLGRAAQLFDPARGVKFGTYAAPHIRERIREERHRNRTIRIPDRFRDDLEAMTAAPLAIAGSDLEDWDAVDHRGPARPGETDDKLPPPPFGGSLDAEDREALHAALARLPDRERAAVEGRLAGRPLREIADELGVTKQRVGQLVDRAVGRLRRELAA